MPSWTYNCPITGVGLFYHDGKSFFSRKDSRDVRLEVKKTISDGCNTKSLLLMNRLLQSAIQIEMPPHIRGKQTRNRVVSEKLRIWAEKMIKLSYFCSSKIKSLNLRWRQFK